ncbi:MAG: flagellar hook-length control protein FliK [Rhodocyclaceae bacterium]|nr:flagellar hook-length control protein FliK [Rhodocyclaceae bacterium]
MPELSPAPVSPVLPVVARPEPDRDGAAQADPQFAAMFQLAGSQGARQRAKDAGAGTAPAQNPSDAAAPAPDAAPAQDLLAMLSQQAVFPPPAALPGQMPDALPAGAASASEAAALAATAGLAASPAPVVSALPPGTAGLAADAITAGKIVPAELAAGTAAGAAMANDSAPAAAPADVPDFATLFAKFAGQSGADGSGAEHLGRHGASAPAVGDTDGAQTVQSKFAAPGSAGPELDMRAEAAVQAAVPATPGELASAATGQQPAPVAAPLAHAAQPAAAHAAAPEPPPQMPLASSFGTRAWNEDVATQLAWMANRHEAQADLVLNPQHLGRIEVSLTVQGDVAHAFFTSPHAAVRDALEQALPELRAMLADAGVTLGQTQVGAESFARQSGSGSAEKSGGRTRGGTDQPAEILAAAVPTRRGAGLVDLYA